MIKFYFYIKYDYYVFAKINVRVIHKITASCWNIFDWEAIIIILFILLNPVMIFHEDPTPGLS